MVWSKLHNSKSNLRNQIVLSLLLLLILAGVGFGIWAVVLKDDQSIIATTVIDGPVVDEIGNSNISEQPGEDVSVFDNQQLQTTLDSWTTTINGTASVVISDSTGKVLASHNADRVFFAASIYKLFVAYEGYRQVDAGLVDPSEVYLNGQTRLECLDKMIRESDSPCAEKLWVEIGKQSLTDKLKTYGITNTSLVSINTTARDSAIMLARISRGEGLSGDSRTALLGSMENQIFRDALNKGFSEKVTVYNKIGFRELVEYHDTAIIEIESGEQLIVSVLTERVGTTSIANLARELETIILK